MKASRAVPFVLAVLSVGSSAQDRKPTLKLDDYGQWERLSQGIISDDGRWYAYGVSRVDRTLNLTLRSVDGPESWSMPWAAQPGFSDDSKWAAYTIGVSPEEAEKLAAQKRRPEPKLVVKNLADGSDRVFEATRRWQFVKGSRFICIHALPNEGQAGSDLTILDLASGQPAIALSGVTQFSPNEDGSRIAVVVSSSSGNTGLQIVEPARKSLETISWGRNAIRGFTWSEKGDRLAWMEALPNPGKVGDNHAIHTASFDAGALTTEKLEISVPEGTRITESSGVRFSRDGSRLAFAVAEWADRPKPGLKPSDLSNVEIWHTRDAVQVPLQRSLAAEEANRSASMVYDLGAKKTSPPQNLKWRNYRLLDGFDWALAEDRDKHASAVKPNGLEYSDAVAVNVWTGEERLIMERAINNVGGLGISTVLTSPKGRYVAWSADHGWKVMDLTTGDIKVALAPRGESFQNTLNDSTLPAKPVNGGLWLAEDRGLILYSDHDIFRVNPRTGQVEQLTEGRAQKMRSRLIDLDTNRYGIDADQLYVSLFDTRTKGSGIAKIGDDGEVKPLMWHEAGVGMYRRSQGTDRVLFRMQSFDKSPNDYVTNLAFSAAKPLTNTNPQQARYAWGKAELVDYSISDGTELQGTLIYPANYDPGRTYPMITYIYERLSDGFHQYQVPSPTNYYDLQHYSQNGYFVFQPDISYRRRNPGLSALECIETGVKAVLAKNVGVDNTKLGLTGHSWGGYETVFVSTHSKMFSCYVAGAPLTELISMSNSTYWNWGQSNQVIFESSQGRMEVAWFEDLKSYTDNSPLFHAKNITAPMLVEVGTVDGAVDWTQGQFLYATLRRMGKNMVMLVYPEENHGLAVEANMKDCARRYQHFFDVYLKGKKPEDWVTRGVPYIDLAKERERSARESGAGK